tara:strand:+ start:14520 stop:15251 length:732 start_codon:yes stop_codon:yes gene_type:complete
MTDTASQRRLSTDQVEAFHHDEFVTDQVADFRALVPEVPADRVVVDVGGGCGFFARALTDDQGVRTRVVDMDPASIDAARQIGVEAEIGDALAPSFRGDEEGACFNLILHHLIGADEKATRALQVKALRAWRGRARYVFVNEYIYQSYLARLSGRLIYEITANPVLSAICRQVARVLPAFKANTFGVGVRFRSHEEWLELFAEAGFDARAVRIGAPEPISKVLHVLLIRTIRRDSFRLEPTAA